MRRFQLPAVWLFIAAVVLTGSLAAGAVSLVSTAGRAPAAPAISVRGNGRPAAALRAALNPRRAGDGQLALASPGLSSQVRSVDSAFAAENIQGQAGAPDPASASVVDAADSAPAAVPGTTVVTIVPGTTLTISRTEVVLNISPQDVMDIENGAALGTAIASLVGSILSVAQVPNGPAIAAIVADSLTVGSDAVKLCAGNDGGSIILSISAPAGQLPSASACGVSI